MPTSTFQSSSNFEPGSAEDLKFRRERQRKQQGSMYGYTKN